MKSSGVQLLKLPPRCDCRSFDVVFVYCMFFFLFFHLQQAACCSLRSSRICCCISDPSFTFWAFCGRVSVSTSKKNKNVQSGCSELRTVPLRLARKQAASLLRSRAISATDDTLMDAMEEQHDSLASSCPQMCPRYCGLRNVKRKSTLL